MVQVVERTDPFGRIGKAVGGGFGEATEEIAKKYALSKGLDRVKAQMQEAGPNISDFDLYKSLATTPGMDAQQAERAIPFLRQDLVRQDLINRSQNPTQTQQLTAPDPATGQFPGENEGAETPPVATAGKAPGFGDEDVSNILGYDPETLTTVEAVDAARQSIPIWDEDTITSKMGDYLSSGDPRYRTVDQARDRVMKDQEVMQQRISEVLNRRGREIGLRNEIGTNLDKKLTQTVGADFVSELDRAYPRLQELAEADVISGKLTPESAAKKYGVLGEKFIKQRNSLKTLGTRAAAGRGSKQLTSDLKQIRDSYEKLNLLDLFTEDMQANNGLGPFMSKSIAYPTNISSAQVLSKYKATALEKLTDTGKRDKSQKAAVELIEKQTIGPDQSINTIAMDFSDRGLDEKILYSSLREAKASGKWKPTAEQEVELGRAEPVTFSLGDYFMGAMNQWLSSEKVKLKTPSGEKLRRSILGKR